MLTPSHGTSRHTAHGRSHRRQSLSLCLTSSHAPSLAYLRSTRLSNKRLEILTENQNYEEKKLCVLRFLVKTWGVQTAAAPAQGQRETPPEAPRLRGGCCSPETRTRAWASPSSGAMLSWRARRLWARTLVDVGKGDREGHRQRSGPATPHGWQVPLPCSLTEALLPFAERSTIS